MHFFFRLPKTSRTYEVGTEATVPRTYQCNACGLSAAVLVEARGVGTAERTMPLLFGERGATEEARAFADADLELDVDHVLAHTPCPVCDTVDYDASVAKRFELARWRWRLGGFVALVPFALFVIGGEGFRFASVAHAEVVMGGALVAAGLAAIAHAFILRGYAQLSRRVTFLSDGVAP